MRGLFGSGRTLDQVLGSVSLHPVDKFTEIAFCDSPACLVQAFAGFRVENVGGGEVQSKRQPVACGSIESAPDQNCNFTVRRRRHDVRVETGNFDKDHFGRNLAEGPAAVGIRI